MSEQTIQPDYQPSWDALHVAVDWVDPITSTEVWHRIIDLAAVPLYAEIERLRSAHSQDQISIGHLSSEQGLHELATRLAMEAASGRELIEANKLLVERGAELEQEATDYRAALEQIHKDLNYRYGPHGGYPECRLVKIAREAIAKHRKADA